MPVVGDDNEVDAFEIHSQAKVKPGKTSQQRQSTASYVAFKTFRASFSLLLTRFVASPLLFLLALLLLLLSNLVVFNLT